MNGKNALAELAKRLRNGLYINPNDKRFDGPVIVRTLDANDVLAAQRIIAKLAKVKLVNGTYGAVAVLSETETDALFQEIFAIAEEGQA